MNKTSQVLLAAAALLLVVLIPLGVCLDRREKKKRHAAERYVEVPPEADKIEGEYILEFIKGKEGVGYLLVEDWMLEFPGAQIIAFYTEIFQGVAVEGIPQEDLMDFFSKHLDVIKSVAEDATMEATAVPSWGLDRIDQRNLPLDEVYKPNSGIFDGTGVDIYVLDTGVDAKNSEFKGRIEVGVDVTGENEPGKDPIGHGSHVAGTAAGSSFGVATGANIVPVRVIKADGTSSASMLIAGMDWVVQEHKARGRQSVINVSLSAKGISRSIGSAIEAATTEGIVVVTGAGNNDKDACNFSPAFSSYAITVASSNKNDVRSSFSNHGSCVDIFAPGSDINSIGGAKDGTSMAAAHVAGAAALLLQAYPRGLVGLIRGALNDLASDGQIRDRQGSPNKLLYVKKIPYAQTTQSSWTDYVNKRNEDVVAENNGDAICGFSTSGFSHSKQDHRYRFKYCNSGASTGTQSYPKNNRGDFNFNCPGGKYISKIESSYDNSEGDRNFRFTCRSFDSVELGACYTSPWANEYEQGFDYVAGNSFVIAGIKATQDAVTKDRKFMFQVCAVLKRFSL